MPKRSRSDSPTSPKPLHGDITIRRRSASPLPKYSRTVSLEPRSMFCTLPPHETLQLDPDEFDEHYAKEHSNRCTACSANLPSAHMLELHIGELHDPLVAAQRDRGEKTYRCFVETCDRACSAPRKRRLHMIDKHLYPRDYDFWVVENGIESGRHTLLNQGRRRRRSNDDRQEGVRKRGGLGKMVGRHARRQSSTFASEMDLDPTPANTKIVFDHGEGSAAHEGGVESLSSNLGSMRLDMTPRSLMLKKNRG